MYLQCLASGWQCVCSVLTTTRKNKFTVIRILAKVGKKKEIKVKITDTICQYQYVASEAGMR